MKAVLMVDAIVIGAGPAGVTVGEELARAGYEVLIFEKNHSPGRNKICGGATLKTCFASLKLPQDLIEKECSKWVVHFPEQKYEAPDKSSFVLFDREAFDQQLANRAVANGAPLMTSTKVTKVVKFDDGVKVQYKELGENLQEARARLVVFADGTSTFAYKNFKVGFGCRPDGTALAAAYDLKYPENDMDSLDFFFSDEISPFGYGWIFPKRDSINVGVLCLLSKLKHNIRSYLDRFVSEAGHKSREVIRFGARLMPQSYVETCHADSVLAVGDAAGTADPIDGGGIFNAIVSGEVAAKVAVEALEAEDTSAAFLAKYEGLWKKTENYRLFKRSYLLQRLALSAGVNIGFFLKQRGFFDRYASV